MKKADINEQLIEIVFNISRAMREGMEFDSGTAQLTVLQLQSLIFIEKNQLVSMGDLANQLSISLPTATILTDKLEKAGMIARKRDTEDRRLVKLKLTKKGQNVCAKAMRERHSKISKMLSYLTAGDKWQLLKILSKLAQKII